MKRPVKKISTDATDSEEIPVISLTARGGLIKPFPRRDDSEEDGEDTGGQERDSD